MGFLRHLFDLQWLASIWVARSAAHFVRGERPATDRSLADHAVAERGLDGLDVAHGARSGTQNMSVDPRHMDTFFLRRPMVWSKS